MSSHAAAAGAAAAAAAAAAGAAPIIKFIANDGTEHTLPRAAAMLSDTAKNALDADAANDTIPVPNEPAVVQSAIEFLVHWADAIKTTTTTTTTTTTSDAIKTTTTTTPTMSEAELFQWGVDFVSKLPSQRHQFQLLVLANYLDAPSLMRSCCKFIAEQIRGKSLEEMGKYFGLPDVELTLADQEKAKSYGTWAEQKKTAPSPLTRPTR